MPSEEKGILTLASYALIIPILYICLMIICLKTDRIKMDRKFMFMKAVSAAAFYVH